MGIKGHAVILGLLVSMLGSCGAQSKGSQKEAPPAESPSPEASGEDSDPPQTSGSLPDLTPLQGRWRSENLPTKEIEFTADLITISIQRAGQKGVERQTIQGLIESAPHDKLLVTWTAWSCSGLKPPPPAAETVSQVRMREVEGTKYLLIGGEFYTPTVATEVSTVIGCFTQEGASGEFVPKAMEPLPSTK